MSVSVSVSVDQLHQAEAAEAKFRGLLESAPDTMVIVDEQGRIELVNRQAELLFGYTRQELLGLNVDVLVPDRYTGAHQGHRRSFMGNPHTRPMGAGLDLYARRKDGTEFPTEISLSPLRLGEGGTLIMAAIRDVTARKATEQRLRESAELLEQQRQELARSNAELARSNAELEQFAYVASHDLQEPLRMVASYTQLLGRRYRGRLDEDADEFIRFAVEGAQRMQNLINDLLAYSRVGTRGEPFAPTDLEALVDEVIRDLGAAIAEAGATVTRGELPSDVPADASQLRQVFQNLLGNAIKFRAPGRPPRVAVTAERQGPVYALAVADNGIGIEPQYAERIFVLFQRLHTQAEYPGTGIGLAICRKIVERHGGQMWVESVPGAGTTFRFTLPTRQPATGSPIAPTGGVAGGATQTR